MKKKTMFAALILAMGLAAPVFAEESHHQPEGGPAAAEQKAPADTAMKELMQSREKMKEAATPEAKGQAAHDHMAMMEKGMGMMEMMDGKGMMAQGGMGDMTDGKKMPMDERMTMMEKKMEMMQNMMGQGGMMGMMSGCMMQNAMTGKMAMMEKKMAMMQEMMKGMMEMQKTMMPAK